ncbi:uncharacterized protein Z518_08924 [Rhinocladiella mackenziei CBS 650.93]|uniref:Uncharacterized protein n=1 Tax=Rhinocladiella mackenziei CBS 650.93 TaxID=1442369 RepID=A0A0D2I5X5_9EURO|nr:uncharacterized protein Z518_08924 [Rhinocladiella mackenziei CBS 650.93]KIX01199.1 hypothetical protein Z518_08924 [Rhinocladiella mackenziei CBS 650.93]
MAQSGRKKSRNGCTNCKRRHVKVGHRPSMYSAPTNDFEPFYSATNEHPVQIASGVANSAVSFCLVALLLMHGILGLSALHKAHERPAEAVVYIQLCDKHLAKTLEGFRTMLSTDIAPEANGALFACSCVLSISSVARSCLTTSALPSTQQHLTMGQVAELFMLTRGVSDMISLYKEWLKAGPFGPICWALDVPSHEGVQLSQPVQKQFDALYGMLRRCRSPADRMDCEMALQSLEDVYRFLLSVRQGSCSELGILGRWAMTLPIGFIKMVSACSPPALIILSHFAVATLAFRDAWYAENWGRFVLRGIEKALHESGMDRWLDWPVEQAANIMCEPGLSLPCLEPGVSTTRRFRI